MKHIGEKVLFNYGAKLAFLCCEEKRDFQHFVDHCEISFNLDGKPLTSRRRPTELIPSLFRDYDKGFLVKLPISIPEHQELELVVWENNVPYAKKWVL